MSRIGRQPIKLPDTVKVTKNNDQLTVTGPKGSLNITLPRSIQFTQKENQLFLTSTNTEAKALHGLTRSLLQNAVVGVTSGFEKRLELVGTGYRVKTEGSKIILSLGFSHPIYLDTPKDVSLSIESNNIIIIKGIDKQLVGQAAANIRSLRPPEPYKGKGIRYQGELVRRKAGKAAKGAATAMSN